MRTVKLTIIVFFISLAIFIVATTNLTVNAEEELTRPHSIEIIINK